MKSLLFAILFLTASTVQAASGTGEGISGCSPISDDVSSERPEPIAAPLQPVLGQEKTLVEDASDRAPSAAEESESEN
jgi:hypothetical protein